MARPLTFAAAIAASLLFVSGAGGTDAQTPKRGGTVVVAWATPEPPCLNPFGPCLPTVFTLRMLGLVLPGAFTIGPDLGDRPNLVSRVDIASTSPFTLVYRIRPGARWSDGVPVTAADFVFTHRIFRDHRITAGFDVRPFYRNIRRVVRVDAKTVRVVFRVRDGFWRLRFDLILPRHVLAGEDITAVWRRGIDNPKTGRAIGSGSFLFGGWQRGREITLVRNPRYWGPHSPHLDRLVARFPADGLSNAEALRSRHVDVLEAIVTDPAEVRPLRAIAGVTVQSAPALVLEHFALRLGPGGHPALKTKLVRQALAYGLDRDALARARSGDARLKTDNAVIARNSRFYRPNWNMYRFDPARARRLLEQAGCRREADGISVCAGERLRLRFLTTAGNPARERTLALARTQLRQIGVDVVPSYGTPGAVFNDILPSGDFDVALFSHTAPSVGRFYWAGCGFSNNFTGYCSRLTNRDLVQANLIVDERQQARVLNAADAKLARDVPAIPLTQLPSIVAHRSNIRNVVPNPSLPWWNAENWWLDR